MYHYRENNIWNALSLQGNPKTSGFNHVKSDISLKNSFISYFEACRTCDDGQINTSAHKFLETLDQLNEKDINFGLMLADSVGIRSDDVQYYAFKKEQYTAFLLNKHQHSSYEDPLEVEDGHMDDLKKLFIKFDTTSIPRERRYFIKQIILFLTPENKIP